MILLLPLNGTKTICWMFKHLQTAKSKIKIKKSSEQTSSFLNWKNLCKRAPQFYNQFGPFIFIWYPILFFSSFTQWNKIDGDNDETANLTTFIVTGSPNWIMMSLHFKSFWKSFIRSATSAWSSCQFVSE